MLENGTTQSFSPIHSLLFLMEPACSALQPLCIWWLWRILIPVGDVRWQNHCCRFDMQKCRHFKEPDLPSKGNDALSAFAVLYSVQSSWKCVIWMSAQWAHYLYRKHLCFQVKYFQNAVLLLALYSNSLSSMKKTNHEKSLYLNWLHQNIFCASFSSRGKECITFTPTSEMQSFLQLCDCLPIHLFNRLFLYCKQRPGD